MQLAFVCVGQGEETAKKSGKLLSRAMAAWGQEQPSIIHFGLPAYTPRPDIVIWVADLPIGV